ncbi:MAG: acetone carboxylase subunit gamma [Candidatus Hadarchaeales archaeon]
MISVPLDRKTIEDMIDGKLDKRELYKIIAGRKDPERFKMVIEIFQSRVKWKEKILLPLSEHLFIVNKNGKPIVKCSCGYEFGDYRINWKFKARVFVRDTRETIEEIYKKYMGSHPDWMELREYYCPGCYTLLEVEAVPPGYPVLFDFLPDLKTLYEDWLGEKLPCEDVKFEDKSIDYLKEEIMKKKPTKV